MILVFFSLIKELNSYKKLFNLELKIFLVRADMENAMDSTGIGHEVPVNDPLKGLLCIPDLNALLSLAPL